MKPVGDSQFGGASGQAQGRRVPPVEWTRRQPFPRWTAALRLRRPLAWRGPLPRGWHPSEVGPLVDSSDVEDVAHWLPSAGTLGKSGRPPVTVIVPTHRHVPWGLCALLEQTWPTEVLVVSNGDTTFDVPGAHLWTTRWQGHAGTRSAALERVKTPLVLMLSDDAVPRGSGFVQTLAEVLLQTSCDAVVARQVPWPDCDATTRARLRRWTPPSGGPMPHADHVATLYRTRDLKSWPRPRVPIAEDLAWTQGRRVVCVPNAAVLHSHRRRAGELYRRRRAEHAVRAELSAPLPVPGLRSALHRLGGAVWDARTEGVGEVANRLAELAGMALGARSRHGGEAPEVKRPE